MKRRQLTSMRVSAFEIVPAETRMPAGIATLAFEAESEGIRNIALLVNQWIDGTQRYDRPGESLMVAVAAAATPAGERVLGIGGLTWCPDVPGALRVRRFYVRPVARRNGIAQALARRLLDGGTQHSSTFTCNAGASLAAPLFWEAMGFRPVDTPGITHVWEHNRT